MAGFYHIDSDCSIIADADMQHPIEIVPEMIKHWDDEYKVVRGVRYNRNG